ncbi:MAG: AMP-binding protein [Chloroflexi bacterium]|nr:AMP-binding protein [Chloroflexota bacterium]
MNIAQILERSRRLFPDKPALIFEGKSFTYRELDERSNRVANGLSALGISRGDRVALFLPNIPAFVSAYFGIQKSGGIAVCVNSAYKSDETRFILDDSGATALVTTDALRGNVPAENLPRLKHIIIAEDRHAFEVSDGAQSAESRSSGTDGSTPQTPLRAALRTNVGDCFAQTARNDRLGEMTANASPVARAVDMAPHDPAVILYTTATAGFPKGATLSHDNVVSNVRVCTYTFRLSPSDNILLFLPAFYNLGQNAVFLPCFDAGATLVLHRDYGSAAILQSIVEHRVTAFFGVPTIYTILFDKASVEQMRSVRFYDSAAAPLPLDIANKWHDKFGVVISDHYGMTEASLVSFNHFLKYAPGSIGEPVEGVEMQLVDGQGRQVTAGQVGEIVVRGPNVMLGYWNRPAETREAITDGWFHTGDLGRADADGYFYFEGYLKDMINVGGQKVYAAEVERVLRQHPSVAEAAVYGIPDQVMGEQVQASIVLNLSFRAEREISDCENEISRLQKSPPRNDRLSSHAEEIIASCQPRLADFKVPKGIEFVDSLPKNHNGEVLKAMLREQFLASLLPSDSAVQSAPPSTEALQDWIVAWLSKKLSLDPETIETGRPFVDYGFTSLMAVTMALDLSRWSGRSVSPLLTFSFPTIDALTRHLENGSNMPNVPNLPNLPNVPNVPKRTEKTDLGALSDDELAKLLTTEIDLARSKTQ